jgi:phosphoglycerol transferase MdoB-like AlkP superfamily enzyme
MSVVTLARWTARILTCLIVLFFGFFLVAHFFGEQGRPSRPLLWQDYVILTTLVVSLAGLLLAWKWEKMGAAIALFAIVICAVVNWKILIVPGTVIPIAALLYSLSSWLRHRPSREHSSITRVWSRPNSQ